MAITKQALDNEAKAYWEAYFGEYGKMWVKEIARHIRTAMLPVIKAAAGGGATQPTVESYNVVPAAHAVTQAGVSLEGVFQATLSNGTKVAQLFCADFSHDGELLDLNQVDAPVQ